jgi:protein TonB
VWYKNNGDIDSVGEFSNGNKDKYWRYGINENGSMKMSEEYHSGKLVRQINFITKKILIDGKESDLKESSLAVSFPYKNPGLSMTDDKPSEFKNGGVSGWVQYLRDNLKTPDRFTLISGPRTSATVLVEFVVNQDGQVVNALIDHSREWSVDMAALKIIKNSPPWFPARQGGRFLMYQHRQKLTFQVND